MRTYTESSTASQVVIDRVEILSDRELRIVNPQGEVTYTVAEACDFERRLDTRLTFSQLRQQICLDYDLGCVDAVTTLKRLYDNGLIPNPDHLITTYSAGVRALASGGQA